MKKLTLLLLILAVLSMGAATVRLIRLTVINKSGFDVGLTLTEQEREYPQQYYLSIPYGDRDLPLTKVYTIVPAVYDAEFIFSSDGIELARFADEEIDLTKNSRLPILPPARSGAELCDDKYQNDKSKLNKCLDALELIRDADDHIYEVLPSLWLTRLVW